MSLSNIDNGTLNCSNIIITIGGNLNINNNEIKYIDKVNNDETNDNKTLYTKKKIDNSFLLKNDSVGKKYYVLGSLKGEIFNDYNANQASGGGSHCEGGDNKASGSWCHCEGSGNESAGDYSHCEGLFCKSMSAYSHASGYYTQADQQSQTAIGEYNTTLNQNALFSIGNGNTNGRSDALVVYRNGEVKINSTKTGSTPKLTIGTSKSITGTTALSSSTQADDAILSTKYYIDNNYVNKNDDVGQKYYVDNVLKGERFNDYSYNTASGIKSHCEGGSNTASGDFSHCEGGTNTASGHYSHCEGYSNISSHYSHCEGYDNTASGNYSHCEGAGNTASSNYSHAGGAYTQADQTYQTAIGIYNTKNNSNSLLSVGNGSGNNSRSDALVVKSTGEVIINSTATGTTPKITLGTSKSITSTTALSSSSEVDDSIITTKYYTDNKLDECVKYYEVNKIIEFSSSLTYSDFTNDYIYLSYSTVNNITISGYTRDYKKYYAYKCSIDENNNISFEEIELNNNIIVKNLDTKQEYYYFVINNTPYLKNLSAGGEFNINCGEIFNNYGGTYRNEATGEYSHSEGSNNTSSGDYSHCEGAGNTAYGDCSHCEGNANTASGISSHCEGGQNIASKNFTHAGGYYTRADQNYQTSIGKFNKTGNTNSLFSVGNGTADNSRSDAFNVFSDGTININDRFNVYVGPITLRLEYNATYNNYHSSFGIIYSWRDGNHKICILSNARVLLPRMTFTTQKIFVSNLYDGKTTDGITGFKNQYYTLYNIDSALGGGFVKVGHFYQLIEGSSGIGALHSYNANAYELTVNFVENDYPVLYFDNCWFCIKNYYSS